MAAALGSPGHAPLRADEATRNRYGRPLPLAPGPSLLLRPRGVRLVDGVLEVLDGTALVVSEVPEVTHATDEVFPG